MDEATLQELVEKTAHEVDRPYYIISGAFLASFSSVEMMLTATIAVVCDMRDLETFHTLTRGMDARVKIERLKQLAKRKNGSIGATLKNHIDFFEQKIVPVRNDLAHGTPYRNEAEAGVWNIVTIETFQTTGFDIARVGDVAKSYRAENLAALTQINRWLFQELSEVFAHARRGEVLEIDHPRFQVPKDTPSGQPQPKPRAKPHRQRKTEPPSPE